MLLACTSSSVYERGVQCPIIQEYEQLTVRPSGSNASDPFIVGMSTQVILHVAEIGAERYPESKSSFVVASPRRIFGEAVHPVLIGVETVNWNTNPSRYEG